MEILPEPTNCIGETLIHPAVVINTLITPTPAEAFGSAIIQGVTAFDATEDKSSIGFVGFGF